MSTQKRKRLEQLYDKYADKAAAYRQEIELSNRPQPAKLFSEQVAELILEKLS